MKPRIRPLLLLLGLAACASPATDVAAPTAAPGAVEVNSLAKPGFVVFEKDGRYWVFRNGTEELSDYRAHGDLAEHVTLVGAGPNGRTLKGPDTETCKAYMAACPGFHTDLVGGRLWVFRDGSPELAEYLEHGEPAECVTRPGAGPMRLTLRGPDTETLDAYLEALRG